MGFLFQAISLLFYFSVISTSHMEWQILYDIVAAQLLYTFEYFPYCN